MKKKIKEITFSRKEVSKIEKELGFAVFEWQTHMINQIVHTAYKNGIKKVYMNTPKTLDAGGICDEKSEFFYNKVPQKMGFKKEKVNLRKNGEEELWAIEVEKVAEKYKAARPPEPPKGKTVFKKVEKKNEYSLEEIQPRLRGVLIKQFKKKPSYSKSEIKKAIGLLKKQAKVMKKKIDALPKSRFFYNWDKTWDSNQRFSQDVVEKVVIQRFSSETQEKIKKDKTLLKFWSFLLSQGGHFNVQDATGFALISPIKEGVWVINEVQTDCINAYHRLRRLDKDLKEKARVTWETVRDKLISEGKETWANIIGENEGLKEKVLKRSNPEDVIGLLPKDEDALSWARAYNPSENGDLFDENEIKSISEALKETSKEPELA